MSLQEKIAAIQLDLAAEQLDSPEAIEQFRIKYLGTKGLVKSLFSEMGSVAPEMKKAVGQQMNALREAAETRFQEAKDLLGNSQAAGQAAQLDLSRPGEPLPLGSRHPVSATLNRIVEIFQRVGFTIAEDREIADDWHNFSALNTPEDHPARDMQDTYYVASPPGWLLRTHTSSVQARVMTTRKPPIRIIAPGRVYRNETVSARSHCQFHQVEVLYIDEAVSFADMKQTLHQFAQAMYGKDVVTRLRPSYFPFTEPSAEMDVYYGLADEHAYRITKGTGWLEIMGCGMVDPAVLETCGIDSTKYSGFACGMGIERQAMIKYRINDIRLLFENDVRFLKQFASVV